MQKILLDIINEVMRIGRQNKVKSSVCAEKNLREDVNGLVLYSLHCPMGTVNKVIFAEYKILLMSLTWKYLCLFYPQNIHPSHTSMKYDRDKVL